MYDLLSLVQGDINAGRNSQFPFVEEAMGIAVNRICRTGSNIRYTDDGG